MVPAGRQPTTRELIEHVIGWLRDDFGIEAGGEAAGLQAGVAAGMLLCVLGVRVRGTFGTPADVTHILGCSQCTELLRTDPADRPPFDPDGCRYGLGPDDGTPLAQCPHPAATGNGERATLCERHLENAAKGWSAYVQQSTAAIERLANGEEPECP